MSNFLKYLITSLVGLALVILIAFTKGILQVETQAQAMSILCDAFFAPGVLFAGFGLIVVASNAGAFDMLAYGFSLIFVLLKRNIKERKYKDFYEYSKAKEEKRKGRSSIAFILVVGLVMVAISMIFLAL
jgi:hypothetical protein